MLFISEKMPLLDSILGRVGKPELVLLVDKFILVLTSTSIKFKSRALLYLKLFSSGNKSSAGVSIEFLGIFT